MATITANDSTIGYIEAGRGDAAPIVFLHGVGSDKSAWAAQLAHCGSSRRAIDRFLLSIEVGPIY